MRQRLIFDKQAQQARIICTSKAFPKRQDAQGAQFYEISNDIAALISLKRIPLVFNRRIARLPFLLINLRNDTQGEIRQ